MHKNNFNDGWLAGWRDAPIHFVLYLLSGLLMTLFYNHYDILSIVIFLRPNWEGTQKFREFLMQNIKYYPPILLSLVVKQCMCMCACVCISCFDGLKIINNNNRQQERYRRIEREPKPSLWHTHKNIGLLITQVPNLISFKCFLFYAFVHVSTIE